MATLIAHYGVLIVILIIFAGEIGLPTLIPGEIAILIAGGQVIHSVPELVGVWLLFGLVDIVACSTIHVASRTGGNRLLLRILYHLQADANRHEETVEAWRRRLGGRDAMVVFVTRLIPICRLYASVTTGLVRVRLRHWLSGAIPSSLLWAATPLTLGFLMRSQIRGMEQQYPQLLHYVLFSSVAIVAFMALTWWVRAAGSRDGCLRRIRIVFSLGACGGALTRLILVALYGDLPLSRLTLLPSLSALSIWVTLLSLIALALLWTAAQDLRAIRRLAHHHRWGMTPHTMMMWAALMVGFCALNAVSSVHQPVAALL